MSLAERDARVIWHPYTNAGNSPPPIPIVRGEGAYLVAEDGRRYLDAISSWWTNVHGHAHPRLAAALARQAGELEHVMFAGFTHAPAVELAERLAALLGLHRVFYSDNGSTAVEAALKIAAQFWFNQGTPRTRFLRLSHSYHGDTVGAMSVSGVALFQEAHAPLLFHADEYADEVGDDVAAVIVEPMVQGASGMRMHDAAFLQRIETQCRAAGALLIADEVMTGFGRTGRMFACEHAGVAPDLVCLSKGLTGGTLPFAATVVHERIFAAFETGNPHHTLFHGHSYTGNPLGCAVALESLELFEENDLLARARTIGDRLAAGLEGLPGVRGLGSIWAVELEGEPGYLSELAPRLRAAALERGVLLRPLGPVLYAMPPLCIADEEADRIAATMRELATMA
ncbi:MAG: aspartate aminotransferase family protein [Planctomycetota bacterium]